MRRHLQECEGRAALALRLDAFSPCDNASYRGLCAIVCGSLAVYRSALPVMPDTRLNVAPSRPATITQSRSSCCDAFVGDHVSMRVGAVRIVCAVAARDDGVSSRPSDIAARSSVAAICAYVVRR